MAVCVKVKNMKIKILVVAITFVVLAALSAAGFYIYKNINQPASPTELPNVPLVINNGGVETGEESEVKNEEVLKETRLLKDDFEITLPPGWQEATSPPEGILLMAIDAKEDVSGGIFQKLEFRTNLSVKSDDITRYASVGSFEDYVAGVKTSLIQTISGISFISEEQKMINGVQAVLIECSSRQEEADFKTLIIFIKGNDSAVYAISFNTFQDSWPVYKSLFYWMAESFKLKYKIEL
jgi:hypothetical protein